MAWTDCAVPFDFVLTVHSVAPVHLQQLEPLVPSEYHSGELQSSWTPATSGGSANETTYWRNPAFTLSLTPHAQAARHSVHSEPYGSPVFVASQMLT
eukprot:900078-Amphidinium_carterae.2